MRGHRPDINVPISVATTPRSGSCLTDRWWVVVDDSVILWRGMSPQCNHDEGLARHVAEKIHPGSSVLYFPVIYLGPQNDDGYYTNPLPDPYPKATTEGGTP